VSRGERRSEGIGTIESKKKRMLKRISQSHSEGSIERKVERRELFERMTILKEHTGRQFHSLVERTAVDYPMREKRFEVVYHRRSVRYSQRRIVKVNVTETEKIPSLTSLFKSANWIERERWEMFGVGVEGHPDRRRILTDYGFEGHPIRKDFPLTGYTEVSYDEAAKRVVSHERQRSQMSRQS